MNYEEMWKELKYELKAQANHCRKQLKDGFKDKMTLIQYGNAIAYAQMLDAMEEFEKEEE